MYAWRKIELLVTLGRIDDAEVEARALLQRHSSPASHMVLARVLVKANKHREADLHLVIARQLGAARGAIREVRDEMTSVPK